MNGNAPLETELEKLEVLRLLHKDVRELREKLDKMHNELIGSLDERDALQKLLDVTAGDATKWRVIEQMALALSEKKPR